MLYPGTNSTIFGHPRPDPGTNGAKSSGYKPGSGERTYGGICRGPDEISTTQVFVDDKKYAWYGHVFSELAHP